MAAKSKRTEAEMLALLAARFSSNNGSWAFIPKVPNATGARHQRTADALAMGLWPSRGLSLHGFEVKVSRSDWLTELKSPEKAEPIARYCDRWWMVVGDGDIIKDGELPETWGLLVAQGNRLVCRRDAPELEPEPLDRDFLAGLLRAACRVDSNRPAGVQRAVDEAIGAERVSFERQLASMQTQLQRAQEHEQRFMEITGVSLNGWTAPGQEDQLSKVAHAVRAALDGEVDTERAAQRLKMIGYQARRLAADADRMAAKHSPNSGT